MDVFEDAGQPDRAADVALQLLEALPEDPEALVFLSDHYFHRDEPGQALAFVLRSRKLRPLDKKALGDEWACRVSLARQHRARGPMGRGPGRTRGRRTPQPGPGPHAPLRRTQGDP